MFQHFRKFFKFQFTVTGVVIAVLFQLIFSIVWMTGYHDVSKNINQLKIAVVTEDQQVGPKIVEGMLNTLPFQLKQEAKLDNAKEMLNQRKVQLVILIPSNFAQQVMDLNQMASVQYITNESNPTVIKSVMQSVIAQVNKSINQQMVEYMTSSVIMQLGLPAEQSLPVAKAISERVVADVQVTNPVNNFAQQMIPMMIVLASYVGAMLFGMNLYQTSSMLTKEMSWQVRFLVIQILNILVAVGVALIGTSLVMALGGTTAQGYLIFLGFDILVLYAFILFSQVFIAALGNAGMLLNIIALSIQLVTSGAVVARELFQGFYLHVGDYLPATYAVNGVMNVLFGGTSISLEVIALLIISVVCIGVTFAIGWLRNRTVSIK